MATWEYCQLSHETGRQGGDYFQIAFFSPDLDQDVQNGVLRDEFSDLDGALSYLGDEGWEAFHIDAEGNWFLKRPDDWDEDWDDDDDYEDDDE